MHVAAPAWSILGISTATEHPSPATTLVTSLVDALIDRTYSVGRVLDLAAERTADLPRPDLLVLGLSTRRPEQALRLEKALALLASDTLPALPVLLAVVDDAADASPAGSDAVGMLSARGAWVLPERLHALRHDFHGARLPAALLAREIDGIAEEVVRRCRLPERVSPADAAHPLTPLAFLPIHC
ncbi:MAG TPA: hypothetical protein VNS22_23865 [Geminicoccus sp.]|uniref:hypothetical protein n=1 Tax=Geminicoccus sp. TaxID=2024832 RepID=UPI002C262F1E|nr:hypothetical protein [Geminicoccus sp.]HWL71393.1 hypothetical protein [Geminicoccus sp.]